MTDDIVARLRSYAYLDDAFYNPWVYAEAADEIERLRAALQRIVDYGLVSSADLERARAALAGEKKDD